MAYSNENAPGGQTGGAVGIAIDNEAILFGPEQETQRFLTLLDPRPSARFSIETYSDMPKGMKKPYLDPLGRRWANMTSEDISVLRPVLEEMNLLGTGVFVAVNQFVGHRQKENLKRVRAIHADLDGVSPEQLAALIAATTQPTMIVQSSMPNRLQAYWVLPLDEVMSFEQVEEYNRKVVPFGADPAAIDVTRLLRLPGYLHMKYRHEGRTPMVRIISAQEASHA
jgi:hypothetical protein